LSLDKLKIKHRTACYYDGLGVLSARKAARGVLGSFMDLRGRLEYAGSFLRGTSIEKA
jgi:hypothetical protein